MSEAITGDLDRPLSRRKHDAAVGPLLNRVDSPADLKTLSLPELRQLAEELRTHLVTIVSRTGGHLAPSLGVVELTIALHYLLIRRGTRSSGTWDIRPMSTRC